jgi:hypothetical protein
MVSMQSAHMGIDGAGVDRALVPPHLVEQAIAALHPAAPLDEQAQQLELRGRQLDLFSAHAHLVALPVDGDDAGF